MRQSSQNYKFNYSFSLVSKTQFFFAILAFLALGGVAPNIQAADPASPTAPASASANTTATMPAAAVAVKPAMPDALAGEALYISGDAKRGVVACVGCHGANGNSAAGTWPKLSAQGSAYIVKQLKNYKDGTRANPIMMGMVAALTDQDMANIAAYLRKQQATGGVAQSKETIELGKTIYQAGIAAKGVPACAGCHSPNGVGVPAQYPRLSGQWAEYTSAQLGYFRDGTRKNGASMTTIASKLSDLEIKAVSDYMAGLR